MNLEKNEMNKTDETDEITKINKINETNANLQKIDETTKQKIREELKNDPFIKLWRDNYNTNLAENLFASPNAKPLTFLKKNATYIKVPIILIVAGPSIDKNIHHLKEYVDKCVIICADVILFKLLEHGIKPDFVVNVDPHESINRFWRSLDTSDLTLICPTTTNPKSIKTWRGRIFFYNQVDVAKSFKGVALNNITNPTRKWGNIFNQFFIGATMFQVASILRPTSVILAGYDFGYTDGKAYCDGFLDLKIYYLEEPEGTPGWKKVIEKLKNEEVHREVEIKTSSNTSIWTTKQFLLYKKTLIKLVNLSKIHTINSTEGGILTELPTLTLESSLKTYCKKIIKKTDNFTLKKRKRRQKKKR